MLEGGLPSYPVDEEWGERAAYRLQLHPKEKSIYLCSLFVKGKYKINGRSRALTTPLYMTPMTIEYREEMYYVSPVWENTVINITALRVLAQEEEFPQQLLFDLKDPLLDGVLTFNEVSAVRNSIKEYFTSCDTEPLLMYPTLETEEKISKKYEEEGTVIEPASALCVLRKSSLTYGVLSELDELSGFQEAEYSSALKTYLGSTSNHFKNESTSSLMVPALLSEAQENIIQVGATSQASVIVGPPGTGKSFTIAAMVMDCVGRGESVLVVSSNNQAVDVVGKKLKEEFDMAEVLMRGGGSRELKKQLKDQLEYILQGGGMPKVTSAELNKLRKELSAIEKKIENIHQTYKRKELREGKRKELFEGAGWWNRLTQRIEEYRIEHERPLWEATEAYYQLLNERNRLIQIYVKNSFYYQVNQCLKKDYKALKNLHGAIKARNSGRKSDIFDSLDFQRLLSVFPVWLVSITEVSAVLPMYKELFDVVIIDEATQCDISSILPALQRAKRVVVAGDFKQLRHNSFLSRKQQQYLGNLHQLTLEEQKRLDYREKSVLDLIYESTEDQRQLNFLDEHFRSHPQLISFSNKQFYQKRLKIMTHQYLKETDNPLEVVGVKGKRTKTGYIKAEADKVLALLEHLIEEQKELPVEKVSSIGILSPYRTQVDYLQKRVQKQLTLEHLQRHDVLVGTAHSFQGEEKDFMMLSMGICPETHPSALQHLNREDVFNVSISRSRKKQWIISSVIGTDYLKGKKSLMEAYLEHSEAFLQGQVAQMLEIPFIEELKTWLQEQKLGEVRTDFEIGNECFSLALSYQGGTFCFYFPGFEKERPLQVYHKMLRVKHYIVPIPFGQWTLKQGWVKDHLLDLIKNGRMLKRY
ncbi:DEAD/DEAH box helicase [Algivirga pacifica]|uniref:DEAD/DEAH box helicase n=2 Tax=Algivirga pacifica TaxID=1162670 RepID=A0ABP9DJC8_9BACT